MKILHKEKDMLFGEGRPFLSCHASTLIELPDGDVLVAYFAGMREGFDDVAIWLSRKSGGQWGKPVKVADEDDLVHWNPVLHLGDEGRVCLYYKVGRPIPSWYTMVIVSDDGGRSWSEPRELVPGDRGGRGPVKNKMIVLQDGTWLAPASVEGKTWDSFVDISRDKGETWTKSAMVPVKHGQLGIERGAGSYADDQLHEARGKGIIQPTLWESSPGRVHMLLRSTDGFIFRSDSEDGGQTWSPAYPTRLPNNNCGIDLARLSDGSLVLAYNPVGMYKGPRSPLLLSRSTDNGESWDQLEILEYEPGEYSYPAVIAEGARIHVSYTWNRQRIAYWMFDIQS
ncbi:sialidase family protein [Paenibacillus sp. HB172176]|uniref:sialidase family protein n=1 Tax=Paenibacillus sp. HB172176 TaxID=2493690 RepID=UPI00143999AB|nr:sialidase family protein [Paenibacillus sp. HB172176]